MYSVVYNLNSSIVEKTYTIETRLDKNINSGLISYLNDYIGYYNEICRYTWVQLTSIDFKTKYPKMSYFITHLCNKYGVLKRTANSIRYEVEGRLKSFKALKEYEKKQLSYKINALENKKETLCTLINTLKPIVATNKATYGNLKLYRKSKKSLYYTQQKLNKKKNHLSQLEYDIANSKYKMCFGTKKLYDSQYRLGENNFKSHKGWYNTFIKNRDKNIYYLGSKTETQGNQMFQMVYDEDKDIFNFKVRKENRYSEESKYVEGVCNFKYQKNKLIDMLKSSEYPLSYRFKRMGTKWYLQVMLIIRNSALDCLTRSAEGTIGLDYNKGFIELSETNKEGNLIKQKHIALKYKGVSNKAINEIREVISSISNYALKVGKDIVIEDLDFKKTKGKTLKGKGKQGKNYNKMIHQLDYSRYKDTFINTCFRKQVGLILVSPYNTSKIGDIKYSGRMKLNVHQSASFVIARRGQGFIDKLK